MRVPLLWKQWSPEPEQHQGTVSDASIVRALFSQAGAAHRLPSGSHFAKIVKTWQQVPQQTLTYPLPRIQESGILYEKLGVFRLACGRSSCSKTINDITIFEAPCQRSIYVAHSSDKTSMKFNFPRFLQLQLCEARLCCAKEIPNCPRTYWRLPCHELAKPMVTTTATTMMTRRRRRRTRRRTRKDKEE